jgi:isopenicillin-N N-acyltransferase like protein
MIRSYVSRPAPPRERGVDFGGAHAREIGAAVDDYDALFAAAAGEPVDMEASGEEALAVIENWAPEYASEMIGIAAGADLPRGVIAALNARTEILARCAQTWRGECSTVVVLGEPPAPVGAGQTWDWHEELSDDWLVWTIEHPDGHRVHTLTEYGILGKIGVNSAGVGLLLNILHHKQDGGRMGVPVHVIARRILDAAADLNKAVAIASSAQVSASSAMTLVGAADGERSALTVELCPAGPGLVLGDERGVLLHTNHFLSEPAKWEDREPVIGPDSFIRYDVLRRRFAKHTTNVLLDALRSHFGGAGALCAHPDPDAPLGLRYATLATVLLDVEQGRMTVHEGGPCAARDEGWVAGSTSSMVSTP